MAGTIFALEAKLWPVLTSQIICILTMVFILSQRLPNNRSIVMALDGHFIPFIILGLLEWHEVK